MEAPLAERIRPQKIRIILVRPIWLDLMDLWHNKLRRNYSFLNFWGPPGTWKKHGTNYCTRIKTTIYILSAINSGVYSRRYWKSEAKWWFIYRQNLFLPLTRFTVSVNHNKIHYWLQSKRMDYTDRRHHRKPSFEVIPHYFPVVKYVLNAFTKKDLSLYWNVQWKQTLFVYKKYCFKLKPRPY
jgi:hypothetical protein